MGWNECKSQNGSLEDMSPKVSDKAIVLEIDHILWASVFGTLLLHCQIKKVLSAVCPQQEWFLIDRWRCMPMQH